MTWWINFLLTLIKTDKEQLQKTISQVNLVVFFANVFYIFLHFQPTSSHPHFRTQLNFKSGYQKDNLRESDPLKSYLVGRFDFQFLVIHRHVK